MKEIFIRRLVIEQNRPIAFRYALIDKSRIKQLDQFGVEHGDILEIQEDKVTEVFKELSHIFQMYESLASGEDLVRLKLFILSEVKRILEERLQKYGGDMFGHRVGFEEGQNI